MIVLYLKGASGVKKNRLFENVSIGILSTYAIKRAAFFAGGTGQANLRIASATSSAMSKSDCFRKSPAAIRKRMANKQMLIAYSRRLARSGVESIAGSWEKIDNLQLAIYNGCAMP
ncbi:hypothetical protein ES703_15987 [subsurface metagenome]